MKKYIIGKTSGKTSPPINDIITIAISSSIASSTSSLSVVRDIFNEYIHADIFRKLRTKDPTTDELDFQKTYTNYGSQHRVMADLYINSMRDALKSFYKNVLIDDYNLYKLYYEEEPSDDFYEALAWQGLSQYNMKEWNDISEERRTHLTNLASRTTGNINGGICSNKK